ncbi:MAG: hypothetical protein WCP62_15980, partial [Planctomycetota bacterium]
MALRFLSTIVLIHKEAAHVSRMAQAAGDCQYTAPSPSCRFDRDATTCKQMLPVGRPNWAPDKCSLGANQITRRLRAVYLVCSI